MEKSGVDGADGRASMAKREESHSQKKSEKSFLNTEYPSQLESGEALGLGELARLYLASNERCERTRKLITYTLFGYEENGEHSEGVGEFLNKKAAENLNRRDLELLRNNLRARGANNNSINHYQAHLRAILAWAVDQEFIGKNPWRDYKRLPVKKVLVNVRFEDVQAVYEHCPPWLQWAIKTAFALCLRPGIVELFRLEWSAFDWRSKCVRMVQGKTGNIKTVVPPDDYLEEAWERYQEDSKKGITLVCTRDGGRVVKAYLKDWSKACKDAGVKLRFYDIRHLAASEMLAGGADLAAVAAQLGHSSVATTGRTYAHVLGDAQKKAASKLPSIGKKRSGDVQ